MKAQAEAHLKQANHNLEFHKGCCENFPNEFYDWKITVLFYCALHQIKHLFCSKGIDIGQTHSDIRRNIDPDRQNSHKVSRDCWKNYSKLQRYSEAARYDGIVGDGATFQKMMEESHAHCIEHLKVIERYVDTSMKKAA